MYKEVILAMTRARVPSFSGQVLNEHKTHDRIIRIR